MASKQLLGYTLWQPQKKWQHKQNTLVLLDSPPMLDKRPACWSCKPASFQQIPTASIDESGASANLQLTACKEAQQVSAQACIAPQRLATSGNKQAAHLLTVRQQLLASKYMTENHPNKIWQATTRCSAK